VTTKLVASLSFVLFLDHPYRRATGSLKYSAMEQSLRHMNELVQTLRLDLPALCDEQGNKRSAFDSARVRLHARRR
jgi:hypothetical protein